MQTGMPAGRGFRQIIRRTGCCAGSTFKERLVDAGCEPPVGSVGDSGDDAQVEMINGLSRIDVIRRLSRWRDLQAVQMAHA